MFTNNSNLVTFPGSYNVKISNKIDTLLKERGLKKLAKQVLNSNEYREWFQLVTCIQNDIYRLDFHYEGHSSLGNKNEELLWLQFQSRKESLKSNLHETFDRHYERLKLYAEDEQRLRVEKKSDIRHVSAIAHRKCVDVSLIRHLAFDLSSTYNFTVSLRRFFNIYDACLEILEDYFDVDEDCFDWNLNLWLTPIRQGGSVEASVFGCLKCCVELLYEMEEVWSAMPTNDKKLVAEFRMNVQNLYLRFDGNKIPIFNALTTKIWRPYDSLDLST